MYQVFNVLTGEAMPVLSDNPYELAGPMGERRQEQKRDEAGNLVYMDPLGNETTEDGADWSTGPTEDGTPEEMVWVDYPPVMVDAGPVYEWREIVQTEAELLADAKAKKLADISAKLAALDLFLPRALEDFWTAINFDVTTLPQAQQDRLAEKVALREKYNAVQAAVSAAEVEAVTIE